MELYHAFAYLGIHFIGGRSILSEDIEEIEEIETRMATVVCRVDFINHLLSDELIRLVEDWNKSRILSQSVDPLISQLRKKRRAISKAIHYSIPLFMTALMAGILQWFTATRLAAAEPVTIETVKMFMLWLLASGVLIAFMAQMGRYLGERAQSAIETYGTHFVFDLTNGDKNERNRIISKNKRKLLRFLSSLGFALIIDVIAAVITALLLR